MGNNFIFQTKANTKDDFIVNVGHCCLYFHASMVLPSMVKVYEEQLDIIKDDLIVNVGHCGLYSMH